MRPPVHLTADACIKCTVCTTACPVTPHETGFAGPKFAGPELWRILDEGGAGDPDLEARLDGCLNCQLCQHACPHGVPVAHLIAWNRDRLKRTPPVLRDRLLGRPDRLGRMLAPARPLVGRVWGHPRARRAAARVMGLSPDRPLPLPVKPDLRAWFRAHRVERVLPVRSEPVTLYVDCQSGAFDPGPAVAAVRLLERLGYDVALSPPRPGCCGAAWVSAGRPSRAVALAQAGVGALAPAIASGGPILSLNSTCGPTVGLEWHRLLGIEGAAVLAERVMDLMTFLARRVTPQELRAVVPDRSGQRIAYHATCRMQGQGGGMAPEVLSAGGGTVVRLGIACCGMAGAYGNKAEHVATSLAVAQDAARRLARARAEGIRTVATDSGTCGWQLQLVSGLPTVHPVEALMAETSWGADPAPRA